MKGVIIHTPGLRTLRQSVRDKGLMVALWLAWTCLWIPAVNLSAWMGVAAIFYDVATDADGEVFSLQFFFDYSLALGGICCSIVAWASYHSLKFRGRCRRKRHGDPTVVRDLAAFFAVQDDAIPAWRHTKRLLIRVDARGGIERVEPFSESAFPVGGAYPTNS